MFKFIVLCACSTALVSGITWSDCSGTNKAITVHSMDLQPNPIIFPGNLSISLNMTVNKKIDHLFIDIKLVKKSSLNPNGVIIPCDNSWYLGSCNNTEACSILDKISNGSYVFYTDFGLKMNNFLLAALGHHPTCPIRPKTVSIIGETVELKPLPAALAAVADGDYTVTIKIKEDPTSDNNVGCLRLNFGIRRQTYGFLFG